VDGRAVPGERALDQGPALGGAAGSRPALGGAAGSRPALGGVVGSGPALGGVVGSGPALGGVVGSGPAELSAALPDLTGPVAPGPVLVSSMACADELPDGLVIADHAGRVMVFNRAASRLTGIPVRAAVGADVRQILALRDADGRCWWVSANPYHGLSIRTRHPEMPLFLPDGTELLVTMSYVRAPRVATPPQRHPHPGGVQRLVFVLRGAQQRARLERNRADLVSTVAHELRSPLTSVKGFTATLLAKWGRFTDDQKKVMLETVNADADRVTRLITELLDVSRIESGRMEIHRQLVSVPERVEKIVAGRVAAGDPDDRYRVVIADGLPETWLDADKVDQILGNLIENAVRHGAGTVTVVVEPLKSAGAGAVSPGAEGIAVSVRDEGDGVAPELVSRIFRQFWRAKRRGGAGLGLYIVKGLVEAHGGTITVQRAPEGGAEFRFTMPAGSMAG
jgi:signal transduction histidine kinase